MNNKDKTWQQIHAEYWQKPGLVAHISPAAINLDALHDKVLAQRKKAENDEFILQDLLK